MSPWPLTSITWAQDIAIADQSQSKPGHSTSGRTVKGSFVCAVKLRRVLKLLEKLCNPFDAIALMCWYCRRVLQWSGRLSSKKWPERQVPHDVLVPRQFYTRQYQHSFINNVCISEGCKAFGKVLADNPVITSVYQSDSNLHDEYTNER